MNVVDHILRFASRSGERTCLKLIGEAVEEGSVHSLTFAELEEAVARMACELARLSVAPGDRVVVQVDKSLAAVALYLAVLRAGGVFVPLNVGYTAKELRFFVEDAAPSLMVYSPATAARVRGVGSELDVPVVALSGSTSEGTSSATRSERAEGKQDLLRPFAPLSKAPQGRPVARSDDDLAAILYTSGTTGRSKGAMLTHGNLSSNATALADIWDFSEEDVLLHLLPIFHVHGLFVALNVALASGAKTLFAEAFQADEAVRHLPQATVFMGVPTHYTRLLAEEGLGRESCDEGIPMRLFTSGSAPLDPVTFARFAERTGHRILERYGMTEAGMITSNPYAASAEKPSQEALFATGERVPGTVGFQLPGVEVRICDDTGTEVEGGTVGTLRVRGPNVFAGYWGLEEKTAEALVEGGWLISGDLAQQDEEGRVTLVGRGTDMIIVGGYNVYPREIEDCLLTATGVAEAAVIGVPHEDMGEGVVACLVAADPARPPEDGNLQQLMARELAGFKRARRIHWLSELPRNAMGKVQKEVLKERFTNDFQS